MPLDLSSLARSATALENALRFAEQSKDSGMPDEDWNVIRAGAIQHFEFCYEMCWKFIKRWLETNVSPGIADGVSRRELFRLAQENLLLNDVEAWMRHHEARNLSSHTYDVEVAAQVYASGLQFATDARSLLAHLEARND